MSIEVTAAGGISTGATPAAAPRQTMDSEVFMALLVAQLRYQDPSAPMDTNEMMSQQTQMASMEQLVALTETSQEQFGLSMRVAAMQLVGREVSYTDAEGETVTGVASSASFATAVPTLKVGDADIDLDKILSINPTGA
ncbi:MAG: flagellar hook assembly protein FlgD [Actinomycetes bacterium]|jgi:flagellar basal-body rod modification protein FlgD